MTSRSELIEKYFLDGLTYEEIIKMLYCKHSMGINLRTLQRKNFENRRTLSQGFSKSISGRYDIY